MKRQFPKIAWAAILVLIAANLWVWIATRPTNRQLIVSFLDVGQGDAIVVVSPSGAVMVIDTGRSLGEDDQGRRTVLPYLRSKGISRIDLLVLTHPDDDHTGGAATLAKRLRVDAVAMPPIATTAEETEAIRRVCADRKIPVQTLSAGMTLRPGGGVVAKVCSPPAPALNTTEHIDNNNSVVMRLEFGRHSFLLTGDAEEAAEGFLLHEGGDLRSTVLKLGHHGSKTSTTQAFLDAVRPSAVVISCGLNNRYGHPHPTVMERVSRQSLEVFRTDQQGTITFTSDGSVLRAEVTRTVTRP